MRFVHQILIANFAIWAVWTAYWMQQMRDMLINPPKRPDVFGVLFVGPLRVFLGIGLSPHGRKVRAMIGIGISMALLPIIAAAGLATGI